jgi:23S rRNA-/tRNA-specific pseudouridylate synthase
MKEERREKRIKEESEVTITVVTGVKKCSTGKVIYNISKDISTSGAKIQSNIFLPMDTLLKIDFKLKNLQQMITAMGKVKWIKIIYEDECYDAGVAFVNTPKEAIQKLSDYISWKLKCKGNIP